MRKIAGTAGTTVNVLNKLFSVAALALLIVAGSIPFQAAAHPEGPSIPGPNPLPPPPPPCNSGGGDSCNKTCDGSPNTGGSVSFLTGHEHIIRTDLEVQAAYPIRMIRQYVSASRYDSPLGYGWAFNHNMRLFEYPDESVVIRTGCGVNYRYVSTGNAYNTTEGGYSAELKKQPDGGFVLTYLDGASDHFDSQGNLTESYDVAGNYLRFSYDLRGKLPLTGSSPHAVDPMQPQTVAYNYRLTKIESFHASDISTGKYVTLGYDEDSGRLTGIASDDGRQVGYHHDLSAGVDHGNLEQVDGLEGMVSTYSYEDFKPGTTEYQDIHNVTEYRDSADSTPVQLVYDNKDRVIKEITGTREYSFNLWQQFGLKTTVTEKNTDDQGQNPTTATRVYEYNPMTGYLVSVTDALGNRVDYPEDMIDAYGNRLREEYYEKQGADMVLVKAIDRTYTTDGLKQTEIITLDSGETITRTWTYDGTRVATEEIVSSTDPSKIFKTETIYNHDIYGKPTTIRAERRYRDNGSFLETSYTYNGNGNLLTTTLPDGHVIENEYSPNPPYNGRYVTRAFHRDTNGVPMTDLEETYDYDDRGNRTHVTDARGNTTITSYDDKNRRETETNAKEHVTTYVYDANDNLTHIIRDRTTAGDQADDTRLTYDGQNRLTKIERTDATGTYVLRSTMRYDSAGNVIARGDAYGNETLLRYDLENRLVRITDADGNYIKYTLNALGHRIKTEYFMSGGDDSIDSDDTLVKESSAVFDDLDRQERMIGANGQVNVYTYDAVGNRITAADALSLPSGDRSITEYTYDTLSRLTNILDANGGNTIYEYDDRDRLRYVTDPRGLTTEYQYNELGQLRFLISPDTGTTEYTYDLAGNRETQTDARGITVSYSYDALNRITGKTYPHPNPPHPQNVSYSYDERANGLGKLTGMTDAEGETEYDYDAFGSLAEKRRTVAGHTYTTQYDYDANDRLVKITYPSGRIVDYTRNALGQVTAVTTTPSGGTPQGVATNISYLPFGALEDMDWGNNLTLDQTFDTDYRLTDQVMGTVYSRHYDYDLVNNIEGITDNLDTDKTQAFNYDDLDRLDDAGGVYGALDYGYDEVGNRINLTLDGAETVYDYSATVNNRLDAIDGVAIGYDANGNTTSKDGYTFTYNVANRMALANDGVNNYFYGYNGKGERVRKTGSASTVRYHYDESGNLLFESDASGATQVEYVWMGNRRLALIADVPNNGGTLYYSQVDHLGTAQVLTDGAGAVVWKADYRPFGEADVTGSVTYNLRFPGQYYDSESGLHYNYFRDYDPSTGRYIESDPEGLRMGINTYIYARDNPLYWIDPYGLVNFCVGPFCFDDVGGPPITISPDPSVDGPSGSAPGVTITYPPSPPKNPLDDPPIPLPPCFPLCPPDPPPPCRFPNCPPDPPSCPINE